MVVLKVLLINAPLRAINIPGLGLGKVVSPPLGISYIAAVLEQAGVEAAICDAQNMKMSLGEIGGEIERLKPDIVAISCFTSNYGEAQKVSELAKKIVPGAMTVIGGPHVSFTAGRTLRETPSIDVVVRGEGEQTMVELARVVAGKISLTEVAGITYRFRSTVVNGPNRPVLDDLDSLPFPARHLWPEKYIQRGMREVPIITSRGCPFACVFCSTSRMAGPVFRARSPSNVVDELQQVVDDFYFDRFIFNDDTFTLDQKRAMEICEGIIERELEITWACSARVDTVSQELLSRMSDAGCDMIYYGVESGNQQILDKFIGKQITIEQARKAVEWAHDAGIVTVASYIIGFPGEIGDKEFQAYLKRGEYGKTYDADLTGTIFESLIRAREVDSDQAQVHLLTPYPGTRLYDEADLLGIKILTEEWWRYNLQLPVIETNAMSIEDIWSSYRIYMDEFDTYNNTRHERRLKRMRRRMEA